MNRKADGIAQANEPDGIAQANEPQSGRYTKFI